MRSDSLFLEGILRMIEGNAESGVAIIRESHKTGRYSPQLFEWLGQLWQLTPDDGTAIRALLQRLRLLPFQPIGKLAAVDQWTEAEPWWFSRKVTHFFPPKQTDFANLPKLIEDFVVAGWAPKQPIFNSGSSILTMGSCFAQELRNHLREKGLTSDWMFVPPGLNNTFALRNFIEWCVTGDRGSDAYWYEETSDGKASKWEPQNEADNYRNVLSRTDGIVLTIGLAEVWYDLGTGGVFWRGIPKSMYDPERHVCKISTVAENVDNLQRILHLIRSLRPDVPIVISLSPVPLKATTSGSSCITSDSVSKSVLRVALHEFFSSVSDQNVRYWPSYEMVKWLGPHLPYALFGEDGNTRHVNRGMVKAIVDSFCNHYFRQ